MSVTEFYGQRARHKEFAHSLSDGREWFRESLPIREHVEKLRKAYGDNTDLNYVYKKHQRDEIKSNSKRFWLP